MASTTQETALYFASNPSTPDNHGMLIAFDQATIYVRRKRAEKGDMETNRTKDFTEENLYSRTQRFEALAWDRLIEKDKETPMDMHKALGTFDFYANEAGREFTKKKKRFGMLKQPEKVTWGPTTGTTWSFRALAVHYKIDKWLSENTKLYRESYELLYHNKVMVFNLEEDVLKNSLFFMPLGGDALQLQQDNLRSLLFSLEDKRLKAQSASTEVPHSDDDDDDELFDRSAPREVNQPRGQSRGQGQAEFDYPF